MKGWKTKTGIIIGVVGGALLAGAQVVPPNKLELAGWLQFAGVMLSFAGTGLGGYGIAHKGEKNTAEIREALGKKE